MEGELWYIIYSDSTLARAHANRHTHTHIEELSFFLFSLGKKKKNFQTNEMRDSDFEKNTRYRRKDYNSDQYRSL